MQLSKFSATIVSLGSKADEDAVENGKEKSILWVFANNFFFVLFHEFSPKTLLLWHNVVQIMHEDEAYLFERSKVLTVG